MTAQVHLCGRPRIVRAGAEMAGPRGAKAWAVLAHLVLAEAPVGRRRLAGLLFADADDPMGALRWNLSQLRRALDAPDLLAGDPLEVSPDDRSRVDVVRLLRGTPLDDHELLALGELLEGVDLSSSPAFDAWLHLERHHLRRRLATRLVEASQDRLEGGSPGRAAVLALRALEVDHLAALPHAQLVRAYVAAGDLVAARRQAARCAALYRDELGLPLPAEVVAALAEVDPVDHPAA